MPRPSRGVAQPGSASHWGCGGRWFESSRPDHHCDRQSGGLPLFAVIILHLASQQLFHVQPTDPDEHGPGRAGQANGTIGLLMGIAPWLLIFVIFYILMIRPQQRRVKEHQAAINAVKKGDEVITGGGIRGRVTKVTDDEAEVEIAQGVKIRVIKSTINNVISPTSKPAND